MDTVFYLIQGTLPVAIPLLLVALGGMFSERSGVINIGLEGIMLSGAFLGCLFVYFVQGTGMSPQLILILAMIIAAAAGAIYSALLSFAAINMKADQTIVGTALNMLIPAAISGQIRSKRHPRCRLTGLGVSGTGAAADERTR